MDPQIALEEAGLSPGEQKVYLALLKTGPCKVTELKKSTSLHRTTIYDFLESLIKKGLVSYSLAGSSRIFKAADPSRLLELIDERKKTIEKSMPALQQLLKGNAQQLDIEVYHGKEGIKTALRRCFIDSKADEYKVVGAMMQFEEHLPYFMEHFIAQIEKTGLKGKVLLEPSDHITKTKWEEWRILKGQTKMPMSLGIIGDFVLQVIWKKPFSIIVIQDKSVAQSFTLYFEALWHDAKKATQEDIKAIHRPLGKRFED